MWQNGYHVQDYRPGAVDHISKGIGGMLGVLLLFSPYLFMPYILYKAIDKSPSPALYMALICFISALVIFFFVRQLITRLSRWKANGAFNAAATFFLFRIGFVLLRIWVVQAGFAVLMGHYDGKFFLSELFAGIYAILLLTSYFSQKLSHP